MKAENGDTAAGLPVSGHYIDGLVDVMMDACRHPNQPLTHEKLFDYHRALFPNGGNEVGHYRTSSDPMRVISGIIGQETIHFEAPPSTLVPHMMQEWLDWVNQKDDTDSILKSAIAALWFVIIHPFFDGNGRISRTITDMLLARADDMPYRYYSMTAAIQKKRAAYYQILKTTSRQQTMNITPWLSWFLNCLHN